MKSKFYLFAIMLSFCNFNHGVYDFPGGVPLGMLDKDTFQVTEPGAMPTGTVRVLIVGKICVVEEETTGYLFSINRSDYHAIYGYRNPRAGCGSEI